MKVCGLVLKNAKYTGQIEKKKITGLVTQFLFLIFFSVILVSNKKQLKIDY